MSKVASITRAGGLIVNPQHATPSTTQYARGYVSEGAVVTDDLHLWLDAGDYASFPGERSLAGAWADYGSHQADYDVVGNDGVILLGTYTSWQGNFVSTVASTGNHTVMFDYWSDNDNTACSVNNDGVNNDDYNATLDADKKKKTFSKTVNLTATGSSTMFIKPDATGSKVYIANYRFFKESGWNDLSGKGNNGTISGATFTVDSTAGPCLDFDGTDDYIDLGACPTDLQMAQNDSKTIIAWIKLDAVGSENGIISAFSSTSASGWSLVSYQASYHTEVSMIVSDGADGSGYWVYQPSPRLPQITADGKFHHVAVTISRSSGTTTIYFYQEGEQNTTAKVFANEGGSTAWGNGRTLIVGKGASGWGNINGQIGSVRVYNTVLTASQIKQDFNAERNRFGV